MVARLGRLTKNREKILKNTAQYQASTDRNMLWDLLSKESNHEIIYLAKIFFTVVDVYCAVVS